MTIDTPHLETLLIAARQKRDQALADLNGAIGEIRVLERLVRESLAKEENHELN